jgi:hypothetical protein
MMKGNMNRLAEGDPTLAQVFSSNLDKKLVLAGRAPLNLPSTSLEFGEPRTANTPKTNGPNTEEADKDQAPQVKTAAAIEQQQPGTGSAPTAASSAELQKESFFRTSNPVFLGIFALVIVIAGVAASKLIFREQPLLPGGVGGLGDNRNNSKDDRRNSAEKTRRSSRDSSGKTSSTASRRGSADKKKKRRSSDEKKYASKVDPVQLFDENAERDEEALKAKIRADFSPQPSPETSRELSENQVAPVLLSPVDSPEDSPVLLSPVDSPEPSAAREAVSVARSEASEKVVSLKKAAAPTTKPKPAAAGAQSDSSSSDDSSGSESDA